jgi:hypothetical protein
MERDFVGLAKYFFPIKVDFGANPAGVGASKFSPFIIHIGGYFRPGI